jgi:D-alanyl-D-alanine carboxypeptidase/D-alanyl-D-alanine-endopeptidase (penicillin-binding protein 4)
VLPVARAEPRDVTVFSRRSLAAVLTASVALAGPVAALAPPAATAAGSSAAGSSAAGSSAVSSSATGSSAVSAASTAALATRVSSALNGSGARTVAAAVEVDGLGRVLRRDAWHLLPPASTQKSFVVATALLAMPRTARLVTEVAATATPTVGTPATATVTAGRLAGSVWLVAGGDPFLSATQLRALARSVRAAGVREIAGDLKLDDSRYDAVRRAPGWKASWVPNESGPLSALAVDGNRWRRDAAFLADPALPAAARFRDMLKAEGVTLRGRVVRGRKPAGTITLARHQSAPLSSRVQRLLKASDNFAAELLLKEVGRSVRGDGSTAGGLAAVRSVLGARGVPVGPSADGSGLSSRDRQTPAGAVALLRVVAASPAAADFRAALPVACVDGTLRSRMCGTAASRNATAKTGTLSGVRALSGYVRTRSGRTAYFAFQITGASNGGRARAALDRAVAVLAASTQ